MSTAGLAAAAAGVVRPSPGAPGESPTGSDRLGLHRAEVERTYGLTRFFYDAWFRVDAEGHEHLPLDGPALLVANHGGMLPADAVMLWHDVLRHTGMARVPRIVADLFVPRLPFLWTWGSRCGAVDGSDATLDYLLRQGELVVVFPEGAPGIGKPRRERHQLRPFRVGHAEHAIRHGVPLVPVGLIGPDEQWPELTRLHWFHAFGAPYLPVPILPLPLPVHYHVRYGPPIETRGRFRPEDAFRPKVVAALAQELHDAVQGLVDEGVRARRGPFL